MLSRKSIVAIRIRAKAFTSLSFVIIQSKFVFQSRFASSKVTPSTDDVLPRDFNIPPFRRTVTALYPAISRHRISDSAMKVRCIQGIRERTDLNDQFQRFYIKQNHGMQIQINIILTYFKGPKKYFVTKSFLNSQYRN